jgi:hypothetical protein
VTGEKQSRVYSVCEGDEGYLWAATRSDEMEKYCRSKNVSKNAERGRIHFVQMRDANEEPEGDGDCDVMKEDGATKTSEDKARVIIGDRVTMKPDTLGNPSGLQFLRSRVTSEPGSVHLLLGGKPGQTVKGARKKHDL